MERPPLPELDDDWSYFSPGSTAAMRPGQDDSSNQRLVDEWVLVDGPGQSTVQSNQPSVEGIVNGTSSIDLSSSSQEKSQTPSNAQQDPTPPSQNQKSTPKPVDLHPCRSCNSYHYVKTCIYHMSESDWTDYKTTYIPNITNSYPDSRFDDESRPEFVPFTRLREQRMTMSSRAMLLEDQEWERKRGLKGNLGREKKWDGRGWLGEEDGRAYGSEEEVRRANDGRPRVMWRSGLGEGSGDE